MKKLLFGLSIVLVTGFVANAQEIKFVNLEENNVLDYGNIDQNADGLRVIEVKNVGKAPLIISNVKSSCGCTVPSFEKAPIMPGKTAKINVKYATNRVGAINKVVTITSNDVKKPSQTVTLRGKVNADEVKSQAHTAVKQ